MPSQPKPAVYIWLIFREAQHENCVHLHYHHLSPAKPQDTQA